MRFDANSLPNYRLNEIPSRDKTLWWASKKISVLRSKVILLWWIKKANMFVLIIFIQKKFGLKRTWRKSEFVARGSLVFSNFRNKCCFSNFQIEYWNIVLNIFLNCFLYWNFPFYIQIVSEWLTNSLAHENISYVKKILISYERKIPTQ